MGKESILTIISHCKNPDLILQILNCLPLDLSQDVDIALYCKLSLGITRPFLITEVNLQNRLKRELIRGLSTHKSIIEILTAEECRVFLRSLQRINQTSYI
jgi:hypothetical protein